MDENLMNEKLPYHLNLYLSKPKLSRHIKLNPTNIALLLQEATQKYWKLTDYRTKFCPLFALLSVYCDLRFLSPSSTVEFFSFLGQSTSGILNAKSDHSCRVVLWFENGFLQIKPARYHCLSMFTITSIYVISCLRL